MRKKRRYIPRRVLKLINEMAVEPTTWTCRTVECGLHSGIKPCCIIWWVMAYVPSIEDCRLATETGVIVPGTNIIHSYRKMLDQYSKKSGVRIGYIPCPSCFLARNFIKVRKCQCRRKKVYPFLHP